MAELAVELAGLKVVKRNGEIVDFDAGRTRELGPKMKSELGRKKEDN